MLCHKCPHHAEIERIRRDCLACVAREEAARSSAKGNRAVGIDNLTTKGRTMVSIDAFPNPDVALRRRIAPPASSAPAPLNPPSNAAERLMEELGAFLRMNFIDQMLLVWILRGGTLSSFARGDWMPDCSVMARQSVAGHVENIKRNHPRLAGVIQDMIAINAPSGSRRKPRRRTSTGK